MLLSSDVPELLIPQSGISECEEISSGQMHSNLSKVKAKPSKWKAESLCLSVAPQLCDLQAALGM